MIFQSQLFHYSWNFVWHVSVSTQNHFAELWRSLFDFLRVLKSPKRHLLPNSWNIFHEVKILNSNLQNQLTIHEVRFYCYNCRHVTAAERWKALFLHEKMLQKIPEGVEIITASCASSQKKASRCSHSGTWSHFFTILNKLYRKQYFKVLDFPLTFLPNR